MKRALVMAYVDIDYDPLLSRTVTTLAANGYSVMVIGPAGLVRKALHEDVSARSEVSRHNIAIRPLQLRAQKLPNLRFLSWPARYLEFALKLLPSAFKFHPDVIHCINVEALPFGYLCSRLTGAKLVYEARELFFATAGSSFLFRSIERLLISKVSAIVCPNEARGNAYAARYNLRHVPHAILNVPQGLEFDIRPSDALRAHLAQKLPHIEDKRVLLYGGLIGPGRGLENAVKEARQFDEGIVLALIGPGRKEWILHLEQLVKQQGLEEKVAILPPVPGAKMLEFMVSADAGLVTYENTSLNNYLCAPTKMWELIHAGTPIIGCDLPEIARLLQEHRVGMLFSCDIAGSLASAVNTLLCNSQLRHSMSASARAIAHDYCWEVESHKLMTVYSGLEPKHAA